MYVEVNGIRLFYEVRGKGPALILVHGNGEDHRIFDETALLLETDHTVYALDSRDHGKSSPVKTLGYDAMAEDVVEFVKALGLERPAFCGFSDGGIIGILAASGHPDLFSKLVLCGANACPQGLKASWLIFFTLLEKMTHDTKILMMLKEPHISGKELERISIPTLVLAGERDMIRESHTRFLASKIKNSRLKILPGEGHGSYVIHSRKLYYIMKKFLEKPLLPENGDLSMPPAGGM
ncbi:alpha/beta hydrolase [Lachnospiraceae bacterium 54-53]